MPALIPAPPPPPSVVRAPQWCRCCHRRVEKSELVQGYGPSCAREHGYIPARTPRPARIEHWQQDGPDLFDQLADETDPRSTLW